LQWLQQKPEPKIVLDSPKQRNLAFSDSHLSAVLHEKVTDLEVSGIVVNLSTKIIEVEGVVNTPIFPWRSTILKGGKILSAERVAVLRVEEEENLGGVGLRGWTWFGDIYSGFPRQTPLYMSEIDTIGHVLEDPFVFTREQVTPSTEQEFEIKLKCWWAPGQTDCFIHNEHPFLEVHTQIHGEGRMQKFRERDARTVYEDVAMVPGFSHDAFCRVTGESEWTYPWHRYFTETEGIWLAVELHPV
jgi:hypothetical protein